MNKRNENAITVRLRGGLGNQLHGFYAGLLLAKKLNRKLVLDGRFIKFGGNLARELEIQKLNFGPLGTEIEYKKSLPLPKSKIGRFTSRPLLKYIYETLANNESDLVVTDRDNLFEIESKDNILLDGYFPQMSHFEYLNHSQKFSIPTPVNETLKFQNLKNEMKKINSLHIRLGDYLFHQDIFPIASEDYYFRALDLLENKSEYSIFVESKKDAMKYFPKLTSFASVIYDDSDFNSVETFSLLSHSKNLICANSTFSSWAGQFVSTKNDGKVICPVEFLKNDFQDFRPDSWIKLKM